MLIELAEGAPSGAKLLDMNNNPVSTLKIDDATYGNDGYSWSVKVVYRFIFQADARQPRVRIFAAEHTPAVNVVSSVS